MIAEKRDLINIYPNTKLNYIIHILYTSFFLLFFDAPIVLICIDCMLFIMGNVNSKK